MMRVGAQLYTLREYCKTLDDFALTLRRVADMGYSIVQVSGSCAFEADWLKKELDRNGLQCVLTHTPAPRILGETQKVCEEHDVFDCRYIGLGKHNFEPEKVTPVTGTSCRSMCLRQRLCMIMGSTSCIITMTVNSQN